MTCPCCGMTHEDPQANRGRCLHCPCVAELRSQIAAMEFRVNKIKANTGRSGGRNPKLKAKTNTVRLPLYGSGPEPENYIIVEVSE